MFHGLPTGQTDAQHFFSKMVNTLNNKWKMEYKTTTWYEHYAAALTPM
jgi:hypothetical protein